MTLHTFARRLSPIWTAAAIGSRSPFRPVRPATRIHRGSKLTGRVANRAFVDTAAATVSRVNAPTADPGPES